MSEQERPYTLHDVRSMLTEQLPPGKHTWLRDPEGNAAVQAYGTRHWPSQPVYVNYRPSVVKMQVRFAPRRISPGREAELWQAAAAAQAALRKEKVTARRQMGSTPDTEKDEQWVVTLPERLTEAAYDTLKEFVRLCAECMGVEAPE